MISARYFIVVPYSILRALYPGSRRALSAAKEESPSLLTCSISKSAFSATRCHLSAWLAAAAACLIWRSLFSNSISNKRVLWAFVNLIVLWVRSRRLLYDLQRKHSLMRRGGGTCQNYAATSLNLEWGVKKDSERDFFFFFEGFLLPWTTYCPGCRTP